MNGFMLTASIIIGIVILAFVIPEYITYLKDKFKN